ncbi:MAG: hypothetical protein ACRBB6_05885 [Neptuniibacter sp.]
MILFATLLAIAAVVFLMRRMNESNMNHTVQPIRVETEEELRRRSRNRR